MAHPRVVVATWCVILAVAVPFALRLGGVAQGGSESIRGSESNLVLRTCNREFGPGAALPAQVVVTSETLAVADPRYAEMVARLTRELSADARVGSVLHTWNSGLPELVGRDGRSTLLLVTSREDSLIGVESFTGTLRDLLARSELPAGVQARVTGMSAMFYDLNRRSSAELLRAEMVGVPLTLGVLLLVFRTALAAGLALVVAGAAVTLSSAFLYLANPWLPTSLMAQNVVTMIGLGAGTDYALFLLSHQRRERAAGRSAEEALVRALAEAGPAVLVAGLAVAGGFAALFLVNARFLHSLALGGVAVIAGAVGITLTLLPALLRLSGDRVFSRGLARADEANGAWSRWTHAVMRRPWVCLIAAVMLAGAWAWPAWRTEAWRVNPRDLPEEEESRQGFEVLARHFQPGWTGPTVLTLEAIGEKSLWDPEGQRAAVAITEELRRQPLVAEVLGFGRLLEALGPARGLIRDRTMLPPAIQPLAATAISADGRTALLVAVPRVYPEHGAAVEWVQRLRARSWAEAVPAGARVRIGGGSAIIHDFDVEMFRSIGRVMLAVVGLTFGLLLLYFRSVAVPLKAIVANLLSVFAAYGFLVLVFQDGHGAAWLGVQPTGGLNSFVILMLFTILFGLSMDYEIFLLSQVRDEFRRRGDNTDSVATGVAVTAGVITSAAAVMVCLFGSFGFFGLTATRQFGLGLAFAVAFDATIVRLLIVPATMRLLGRWNWWLPVWNEPTVDRPGVSIEARAAGDQGAPGTS
ncbi:MAG: MMPL family transporter [Verrucomicrobia bacterium]|nr:MMPL family transporter [Verrucomicrobiota bacterium]